MSQVHCSSLRSPIKFCISPARKELREFDLIERKKKGENKHWVFLKGTAACHATFIATIHLTIPYTKAQLLY